ncbi:hypothetical protein [Actinoplanes sp. NPDC051494]|uniref:hypothetical protein n=1 Tax=Actinoplanes sp. NPDC051494 TaxID=3363907 RepID=UPI0037A1CDA1
MGRALSRLATVAMIVMVAGAGTAVTGRALGYRTLVERSDSMAPAIYTGDLLLSRDVPADSARTGDIITFPDVTRDGVTGDGVTGNGVTGNGVTGNGVTLTHRVVSVRRNGDILIFVTRGDANTAEEQWTAAPSATIGRTLTVLPGAGKALGWLSRPGPAATFAGLLVAAIVLLLGSLSLRRRPAPRPEQELVAEGTP